MSACGVIWSWDHSSWKQRVWCRKWMRSFVDALFYESFLDAAVWLAACIFHGPAGSCLLPPCILWGRWRRPMWEFPARAHDLAIRTFVWLEMYHWWESRDNLFGVTNVQTNFDSKGISRSLEGRLEAVLRRVVLIIFHNSIQCLIPSCVDVQSWWLPHEMYRFPPYFRNVSPLIFLLPLLCFWPPTSFECGFFCEFNSLLLNLHCIVNCWHLNFYQNLVGK